MEVEELIGQLQKFTIESKASKKANASLHIAAAQQVADELIALQSIFGSENVALLSFQTDQSFLQGASTYWRTEEGIRLCITVPIDLGDEENLSMKLSATLPSGYPEISTPPHLQLLSRYIGSHGVDHSLFGQILRIFFQSEDTNDHIIFKPGEVCLFDGIERVREKVEEWYSEREAEVLHRKQGDRLHGMMEEIGDPNLVKNNPSLIEPSKLAEELKDITVFSAPAITERKSIFVGHAAILTDVSQVSMILDNITLDKKVARASHPTIYAWVCRPKVDGAVHRNCHDDGETAAGGRLAHLLDLLHLENVIIVVTRWYGGVHLGADRFKLINRAARDALEVAQLVSGPLNSYQPGSKSGSKR